MCTDSDAPQPIVDPKPTRGLSCFGYGVVAFVLLFILAALLLPAIQSARPIDPGRSCRNRLKQLAVALGNYHEAHRRFPPACTYDANGRPLHSWRVLVLPYLEETIAYQQLDLNEPWNSPRNWSILEKVDPGNFHCPAGGGELTDTTYLAVVGSDGAWSESDGTLSRQFSDRLSQTIQIVEVRDSGIHWAEPRDLPWEQAVQGINPPHVKFAISSGHGEGAHVAYTDSHVRFLETSTPLDRVHALLTRAGGELVEVEE